jgi:lysine/ornithine N-monooxygenase
VPPIYVNGPSESTRGLGDTDSSSLLAIHAKAIVQSLRRRLAQAESAPPAADLVGLRLVHDHALAG